MGPSGSGKSTLLNCILGNAAGTVKGDIFINGEQSPRDFKVVAKLIPQEDVLLPSFTVRETMEYQAQLSMSSSIPWKHKLARIEAAMRSLSLLDCADTRIGDILNRGISGGQRKRTSIALELLSNPCCICVDEPTSGLDSKTAEDVVRILSDLVSGATPRTIITTIHQPSYRIFGLFDRVVFLSNDGRVAYNGSLDDLETYFNSLSYYVPPKENPADHYMRLLQGINPGMDDEEEGAHNLMEGDRNKLSVDFAKSTLNKQETDTKVVESETFPDSMPRYPTGWMYQTSVLFRRTCYDTVRDFKKFARILFMKMCVGVLVGIVWYGKGSPPKNENLLAIQGVLFMLVMTSVVDTLALTILMFPIERALLLREYKNGSFSISAWYISKVCLCIYYYKSFLYMYSYIILSIRKYLMDAFYS